MKYPRTKYPSRGARRTRDKIVEGMMEKNCIVCEKRLERKRFVSQIETLQAFQKRKTCSTKCAGVYRGSKMHGSQNYNYKGKMDKKCMFCGVNKLTYTGKDRHPKMCISCYNTRRSEVFEKDHFRKIGNLGLIAQGKTPTKSVPA